MTSAENAEFERRGAMADMMNERLDAAARSRPDFAGLYIDNYAGGKIVVLTTGEASQVQKELAAVDPRLADDLVVRHIEVTEEQLKEAVRTLPDSGYFGDVPVYALGVDLPQTRLIATVPQDRVAEAEQRAAAASRATDGVAIVVEGGEPELSDACLSRENCTDPIRAGVLIRQGSTTGGRCTMGFHVTTSTGDHQFLTAGHCGYTGSTWWYHRGYGLLGGELATRYFNGGEDVMRVSIPDGQTTGVMYGGGTTRYAVGPTVGLAICASMGASNTWDCGTVGLGYTSWISSECNCRIYGARHTGISRTGGDSGSPIRTSTGANAVGLHNTAANGFAIVLDALDVWNLTMR